MRVDQGTAEIGKLTCWRCSTCARVAFPLRPFQHEVTISLGLALHIRTLQFLLFFHSCFNGSMDVRPTILLGSALPAEKVLSNNQPTPCCHRDWHSRFGFYVRPPSLLEIPRIDSCEAQMVGSCSIHSANGPCRLFARSFAIWLSNEGGQQTLPGS